MNITKKYDDHKDLRKHLAHWIAAWGVEPQPEWMHMFFHSLEMIPQQWYLKTELRHRTTNWDEMIEGFLLTYNYANGWECIVELFKKSL